jgi:glycosyltransferase involved in cell wall biosynthesis
MDPVRIALDVGSLYGHRTGVGAAVAELAVALDHRDDVEVTPYVLSFRSRPAPPVRKLPLPAAVAHRLWSIGDVPRVDRWVGPAEVVHGTNYVVPPTRRPAIASVYDCWFLRHPAHASPDVRRAGEVLRRRARAGVTIHASSQATADIARELLGARRVEVVHLGPLAVPDTPPAEAPRWAGAIGPFVLAIGTIERRKNVPALVAAFGAIGAAEGASLVLAGAPGDDSHAVEAAVAALPAASRARVVRPGPVDDATKSWLLHHARLLAYPSLDEGFGFPILEAQAIGLPIVATCAGSIPEVAGGGAELVPVGDGDALAAALRRVLTDDDRRRQLVTAGQVNVARFSWSATAEEMVRLYRQVREEGA